MNVISHIVELGKSRVFTRGAERAWFERNGGLLGLLGLHGNGQSWCGIKGKEQYLRVSIFTCLRLHHKRRTESNRIDRKFLGLPYFAPPSIMVRYVVYPAANLAAGAAADDIGDKLVKYVPAELTALFNLVYLAFPKSEDGGKEPANKIYIHITMLVLFCLLTPMSHLARGAAVVPLNRLYYFLPLTAVAFFGWAVGTTTFLQDVLGDNRVNDAVPAAVLACTVFLVPLADEGFSKFN
jgi:hypothetical protein